MVIGIVGAGSWGTALAQTFACNGHKVYLYARRSEHREELEITRENKKYLPGVNLVETIIISKSLAETVLDRDMILMAVPTQTFRSVYEEVSNILIKYNENPVILNVAKGIEKKSHLLLSEVAKQVRSDSRYAVLSGPSHAEEVGRFKPTTVAIASSDINLSKELQRELMTSRFRIYANDDLKGVELGGALKNIIALGAGISDGIGFGDNARAALMTRGLVEMTRIGTAMGAKRETFSGLTGLGDLIVTCDSKHSRNRRCGILIGEGMKVSDAIKEVGMVVEGITTTEATYELAGKLNVDMPITETIYKVIEGKINALEAVDILMGRDGKVE
ncbi:MAG: NAD(P)H-dependent glycerol-3-phosphate dehydrogenase [Clostridiales bacterium]|nr:NAD(P)H-dependent glycerol-3-phosphate dehydrogenase [Clostridiales bacterium]MDY6116679.1 NAD(P)H-dependent glycerol-3-phosphate dehydrogenase [Anaerovoracaceae bacterium]